MIKFKTIMEDLSVDASGKMHVSPDKVEYLAPDEKVFRFMKEFYPDLSARESEDFRKAIGFFEDCANKNKADQFRTLVGNLGFTNSWINKALDVIENYFLFADRPEYEMEVARIKHL